MAQSTISQRIALEGAEEILKQLADLGQAGEKAVQQIKDATAGMGAGLGGLSGFSALVQSEFGKVSAALAPVRADFAALEEAAKGVGERIVSVASVLGVGLVGGLAGGIAGFVELIKSSAEAGHQLEVQAGTLGLNVEQLQAYRKVAAEAGVDGDRVFTALTKLTQNLGKETEKLTADTIKAFEALPAAMSAAGTGVLRGSTQPQTGTNRGITGIPPEAIASVNEFTQQFAKAAEAQGKVLSVADIERYRQSVLALAGDVTAVGEKFRLAAAMAGVPFPALTQGEELKRNAEIAADPVLRLGVSLKDLQAAGDNLDPIIRKILDGLRGISDPAQKNQIALALLGRSAKELTEAFSGGSGSLDDALAKIRATGLGLSPEQAALLSEAEKDFVRLGGAAAGLRNQLSVIFAPALIDVTKAFTDLIKNNADTFKSWAQVIASDVLPGIANLIQQFTGVGEAAKGATGSLPGASGQPSGSTLAVGASEPARQSLITLRDTAIEVATAISTAFTTIRSVLSAVATAINAVFGTMLTAAGLAAVLVVGTLSGAFSLLLPLITLVAAVIGVLTTPIGLLAVGIGLVVLAIVNWRSTLEGLTGAVAAVARGISADFSTALTVASNFVGTISGGLQSLVTGLATITTPVFAAITAAINAAVSAIAAAISPIATTIASGFESAISLVEQAFNGLVNWVSGAAQSILRFLQPVFDFISRIASGLAGLVTGGGAAPAGTGGDLSGGAGNAGGLGVDSGAGMAFGGRVPGGPSGTDTVPAWLTPGEYVVRAQAVTHYGSSLLHAINNMRLPWDMLQGFSLGGMVGGLGDALAPAPSPLMLAAGGAVMAPAPADGRLVPVHLHMPGGESFQLDVAPGQVFDKLARHARSSAITRAGRMPSWFAS